MLVPRASVIGSWEEDRRAGHLEPWFEGSWGGGSFIHSVNICQATIGKCYFRFSPQLLPWTPPLELISMGANVSLDSLLAASTHRRVGELGCRAQTLGFVHFGPSTPPCTMWTCLSTGAAEDSGWLLQGPALSPACRWPGVLRCCSW